MFTLVTSNEEKVHFARLALLPLGVEFTVESVAITEIQAETPEEVILNKAEQAYVLLQKPIVVTDHWWSFTALNGFPGPYMHYMNDHLTATDLLRLMEGKENREVSLTESICYADGMKTKVFSEIVIGEVLFKAQGKGLPGQQVISLSEDGKSIATCLNERIDPRSEQKLRQVWSELAAWLITQ